MSKSLTQRQFLQLVAQTSEEPLMVEVASAEGCYVYDQQGKKYFDLIAGIGVSSVGHRHPAVIDAIKSQVDKNLHVMVFGEFVQTPQVKLAEALSRTLPDPLEVTYFVNSGSEAAEGALKLAKRYTGRFNIISCIDGYHGSSHGALSASGNENLKQNFRPLLPGFQHIAFGNVSSLDLIDFNTAAVIIETVQGEAGVRMADKAYFKKLRKKCNETGALLILDEIQCGFGRTGKLWAFEHYDIQPDILLAAKGMGGGMPIGCFISSKEIMSSLKQNPILGHITTFGGHPISTAASLATLETIQNENLIDQVAGKALLFKKLLKHDLIKSIRNQGLLMAVEFESYEVLKRIIDRALEAGIITDWFLFCNNSMRIAPPLTISEIEIKEVCQTLLKSIEWVSKNPLSY
ncbi:aspartate aminotransferase family protein [Cyclobacteriaceae bacterium]|nr:aspartate aminotransferase family protein [Cyclobacteriaceae bacterium]MDB4742487.1 aspartate aminotransferase family protein [Cyclobacteriaceae bacterium]